MPAESPQAPEQEPDTKCYQECGADVGKDLSGEIYQPQRRYDEQDTDDDHQEVSASGGEMDLDWHFPCSHKGHSQETRTQTGQYSYVRPPE